MKLYHKNPREITGKQFSDLGEWLEELGDLSGIVHNLPTDEVISGNQRFRVFSLDELEIVITEEFDEPDKQGTLKRGYAIWRGGKYNYRAVVWTPEQCEKANIVANKSGGTWDVDELANKFEIEDLLNWGFDEWELGLGVDESEDLENKGSLAKNLTPDQIVRAVLYLEDVKVFEGALRRTGKFNRADALAEICKYYMENHGEKGQLDFAFEDFFEEKSAQGN